MRYALFDWDGTLVDSMPFWYALPERYCKEKGVSYDPALQHIIGTMTMVQAADALTKLLALDQPPETTFEEFKRIVRKAYWEEIPLNRVCWIRCAPFTRRVCAWESPRPAIRS